MNKLEILLLQLEHSDNILLDSVTIAGMMNDSGWFECDSMLWRLACAGLAGDTPAALNLIDAYKPGCNVYSDRVWKRAVNQPPQAYGVIINPPEGGTHNSKAYSSLFGRAAVVALLRVDISINKSNITRKA